MVGPGGGKLSGHRMKDSTEESRKRNRSRKEHGIIIGENMKNIFSEGK